MQEDTLNRSEGSKKKDLKGSKSKCVHYKDHPVGYRVRVAATEITEKKQRYE